MPLPHETGGTGPRPTQATFLAAVAQRTAKTQEVRREREMRKDKMREEKVQREKALRDVPGLGAAVMGLLGLRRVRKGRGVGGGQVERKEEVSNGGGGDAGKDGGGISKAELPKDTPAIKEPEKGTVENDIVQSAGYDGSILSHGDTCDGSHHGMPHISLDGAGDDGHVSIGKRPHGQDEEVKILLDADVIITARWEVDSDTSPEDIQPPVIVPAPDPDDNAEGGSDPGLKLLGVLRKDAQLDLESDMNPDDIRQPTINNLDSSHNDESPLSPTFLKNTLPQTESDINLDDIRAPIVVPAPEPGDSSDPTPSNNAPLELEGDLNPDNIKPHILVPAPDLDDSAGGTFSKDRPAELESSINPDEIQPPIIVAGPTSSDNANDFHGHPPEIQPNLLASLAPHDADLDVQIQHDVRDRSHQLRIFHPPGRPLISHTHMMKTIYSRQHHSSRVPGSALMKCSRLSVPHRHLNSVS